MKGHFYFEVMRRTIIQFLNLFNDIRIARYDETGRLIKFISIPLKFAPKTKHWWWVEKQDSEGRKIRDILLPFIGISMTDIALASNRITNKHAKIRAERILEEYLLKRFKNPVPYDFTFEVKIASEYMIDSSQIIEQILPFFDPTAYIRVTIPELKIDHKEEPDEEGAYPMDLKVIYEGSSQEISYDMAEEEYRVIVWTLTFKVEGYLFKPVVDDKVIKTALVDYYNREKGEWPVVPQVETITEGLSAEKWPVTLSGSTTGSLSGALYDESAKLLYTYERKGE